jgi:hypothetical protein
MLRGKQRPDAEWRVVCEVESEKVINESDTELAWLSPRPASGALHLNEGIRALRFASSHFLLIHILYNSQILQRLFESFGAFLEARSDL